MAHINETKNLELLFYQLQKEMLKSRKEEFTNLGAFTASNKAFRDFINRIPTNKNTTKIKNRNGYYEFLFNGKKYPFTLLSDEDIQELDKKIVTNIEERSNSFLGRTLKLAGRVEYPDAVVKIGKSDIGNFSIIVFTRNGQEMVIDYENNLVMKKADYYEMTNFKELNSLNKKDVYWLYRLLSLVGYDYFIHFILFSDEMFKEIEKIIPEMSEKYDVIGVNNGNKLLLGEDCDATFIMDRDMYFEFQEQKFELDSFTLNPTTDTKKIKKIDDGVFLFKDKKLGDFAFQLLSSIATNEDKKTLLSEDRYRKCHVNAIRMIRGLSENDKKQAFVCSGYITINDKDKFLHSWIEIGSGDEAIVADYNHNVIMGKDKYYQLYGASIINKLSALEETEVFDYITRANLIGIDYRLIDYFGQEIVKDLKKNEKILMKK